MSGDMLVRVEYGDLSIVVNAEDVSWSGEVMRDLMTRALDGLARGLEITSAYTISEESDGDVDEADVET